MPTLNKILEELGLSDKEAKVYLACLELGPSPVQKIAEIANINRVTTYVILESLAKKGLATTSESGKKTLFMAEDPQHLSLLLNKIKEEVREKENALEKIMPELKGLFRVSDKKPIVRVYEGKEGLLNLQQDYIKSTKAGGELVAFVPIDYMFKIFPPQKEGMPEKRKKKRISARVIYNSKEGNILENDPKILRKTHCVPADKFPFKSGVDIYGGNKLALINYKDKPMGILLESKELHDTFKIIFEMAWEAAEKYQKNMCGIKKKK